MKTYPDDLLQKLDLPILAESVTQGCLSDLGRMAWQAYQPLQSADEVNAVYDKITAYQHFKQEGHKIPFDRFKDIRPSLDKLKIKGMILELYEVVAVLHVAETIHQVLESLDAWDSEPGPLHQLIQSITRNDRLVEAIKDIVNEDGQIRSDASEHLSELRIEKAKLSKKIHKVFQSEVGRLKRQGYLFDSVESVRNGRRVLALKAEHKRKIQGILHDESESGKVVFIEPESCVHLHNDLFSVVQAEQREIQKLLDRLTQIIEIQADYLAFSQEIFAELDILQSKASWCDRYSCSMPTIESKQVVQLIECRNASLLVKEDGDLDKVIPFDVTLDNDQRILLISGPNAGGKSMTLKALGLIQMLIRLGLPLPCSQESNIGLFDGLYADLGDDQSLENELSTYSSKLAHMKYFLENASAKSLVLIDEFGSGSDPKLGAALAESLLLALCEKKCIGVITTHYGNLKQLASHHQHIINGSMHFDETSLSPTYQLLLGKPGASYTFEIAKRMAIPLDIIEEAKQRVDHRDLTFDETIHNLEMERRQHQKEHAELQRQQEEYQQLLKTMTKQLQQVEEQYAGLKEERLSLESHQDKIIQDKLNTLLKDIHKEESAKAKADQLQDLVKRRAKLRKQQSKSTNASSQLQFSVGDQVRHKATNQEGEILEIRGRKAIVNISDRRAEIAMKDLELSHTSSFQVQKPFVRKPIRKSPSLDPELDIRGMTKVEAIDTVELYLTHAKAMQAERVRIIHGKGQGVLRQAVLQALRSQKKHIESYQHPEEKDGGRGVMLVHFSKS
jgi:DNA mismatch repair protein MutS2